jgi:hypothetical protein
VGCRREADSSAGCRRRRYRTWVCIRPGPATAAAISNATEATAGNHCHREAVCLNMFAVVVAHCAITGWQLSQQRCSRLTEEVKQNCCYNSTCQGAGHQHGLYTSLDGQFEANRCHSSAPLAEPAHFSLCLCQRPPVEASQLAAGANLSPTPCAAAHSCHDRNRRQRATAAD